LLQGEENPEERSSRLENELFTLAASPKRYSYIAVVVHTLRTIRWLSRGLYKLYFSVGEKKMKSAIE